MELIDNLKTNWKVYNKRANECKKIYPSIADHFPLMEEGGNRFTRWADAVEQCDLDMMYTKETATDLRGFYIHGEHDLAWCDEYEEDCDRRYGNDFKPTKNKWETISTYGVADNIGQIQEFVKEQEAKGYDFGKCIIDILPIFRKEQPADGGWRWHKWGRYIGNFEHCNEYIADEDGIELVLCFSIVPLKPRKISLEEEYFSKKKKRK